MNKKVLFVLFAILMMAVMTVSVSADQDGYNNWCNSDQYGCWVTGDGGAQVYIMFWSESAREYFMGPGSNAVVADPVPGGKMPLAKHETRSEEVSLEEMVRVIVEVDWKLSNASEVFGSKEELKEFWLNNNRDRIPEAYQENLKYLN